MLPNDNMQCAYCLTIDRSTSSKTAPYRITTIYPVTPNLATARAEKQKNTYCATNVGVMEPPLQGPCTGKEATPNILSETPSFVILDSKGVSQPTMLPKCVCCDALHQTVSQQHDTHFVNPTPSWRLDIATRFRSGQPTHGILSMNESV